jgi:divalent metal cation (Fe/Co/Zn/Cd) transporter
MIVPRTWKLLRETLNVLLEAAPEDVDMAAVRSHIRALPGVEDVHDLHAWTITSGLPVLSAHVVVGAEALDTIGHEKMLHELRTCLGDHFDVEHCTFQLEPDGHAAHETAPLPLSCGYGRGVRPVTEATRACEGGRGARRTDFGLRHPARIPGAGGQR